jgi:hypothetical protein
MLGKYLKRTAGLILTGLLAGCASGPHSSHDAPPVTLVPDNRVILEPAVVLLEGGSIDISGSVHRQPTLSGAIAGRVDIEFVAPNGELLDELPALLIPHDIEAGKSSAYHTNYSYIPPKGSTLRIHFVDSDTESREDIEGEFFDYDGAGGGGGGGGNHGDQAAGTHPHANWHYGGHGGYGGGFGNVNFSPNGRH